MPHGLRGGSTCLGVNTKVLVKKSGSPDVVSRLITEIECVFTEEPNLKSQNKHFYPWNKAYEGDMVVNLAGGESTPLFTYFYDFKGEHEKLYQIIVEPPKELGASGFTTLIATEWHPIMRSETAVTVASLLDENDDVLVKVGDNTGIGKVLTVVEVTGRKVIGLALGKVQSGEDRQAHLEAIQKHLEAEETYWNDFDLDVRENIMFTESTDYAEHAASIASGTLALQYQLRSVIKHGIGLNQINAIELMLAREHNSENQHDYVAFCEFCGLDKVNLAKLHSAGDNQG
jgi:hypothetical protein